MIDYSKIPDIELVALLKTGDREAFAEIYTRYKRLLFVHAYKRLKSQEEVEDIIHELFATLWAKHETITFKTHLSGYLYTSIRNRILDKVYQKQKESVYIQSLQKFIDEGEAVTDHLARHNEMSALIEKEIAALPRKMRVVFELSRKAELSHREIAEQLDISEQTVRKHVQHAL
ncbi:MAG TPA: sigma-70 family RNA polymerase sigma factor, partial [Mucilaginibacter sp.]|nr:sigma-70 family RNA polymerase sigma factor [Mucilaginibacter sp.]